MKPILVIGYERSGTTLLRRLVSMHPDLEYELIHERKDLLFKSEDYEHAVKIMTYPATQNNKKTGSIMSIRAGIKIPYLTVGSMIQVIKKFFTTIPNGMLIHITRDSESVARSQAKTFGKNYEYCLRDHKFMEPNAIQHLKKVEHKSYSVQFDKLLSNPLAQVRLIYEWMQGGSFDDEDYISKVISTRNPWKHKGRVMPGLRYFDRVGVQK